MKFIFRKQLAAGQVLFIRVWEEIDEGLYPALLEGVQLQRDELPVIAMLELPNRVLVTTRRVIWGTGDKTSEVDLASVSTVRAPKMFKMDKSDLHELTLTTDDGQECQIETKPGTEFWVLWNFLLRITGWSPKSSK